MTFEFLNQRDLLTFVYFRRGGGGEGHPYRTYHKGAVYGREV